MDHGQAVEERLGRAGVDDHVRSRPELVGADVGDGGPVGGAEEAALIGERGIERVAGVNCRATGQEARVCVGPPLSARSPEEGIDQAQVAGGPETAGAVGVDVVAERCEARRLIAGVAGKVVAVPTGVDFPAGVVSDDGVGDRELEPSPGRSSLQMPEPASALLPLSVTWSRAITDGPKKVQIPPPNVATPPGRPGPPFDVIVLLTREELGHFVVNP